MRGIFRSIVAGDLDPLRRSAPLDLRLLDRDLKAKIADWTRLLESLGGNITLARQVLRKLVSEKRRFTPDLAAGTCAFVGRSTVWRVLH